MIFLIALKIASMGPNCEAKLASNSCRLLLILIIIFLSYSFSIKVSIYCYQIYQIMYLSITFIMRILLKIMIIYTRYHLLFFLLQNQYPKKILSAFMGLLCFHEPKVIINLIILMNGHILISLFFLIVLVEFIFSEDLWK